MLFLVFHSLTRINVKVSYLKDGARISRAVKISFILSRRRDVAEKLEETVLSIRERVYVYIYIYIYTYSFARSVWRMCRW